MYCVLYIYIIYIYILCILYVYVSMQLCISYHVCVWSPPISTLRPVFANEGGFSKVPAVKSEPRSGLVMAGVNPCPWPSTRLQKPSPHKETDMWIPTKGG